MKDNNLDASELTEPIDGVVYTSRTLDRVNSEFSTKIKNLGWSCQKWTDSPATEHPPHEHPYAHRVLAVSGWIEFTVNDSDYQLTPGDTLDLPENVTHSAVTAPDSATEYWLLRSNDSEGIG